MGSTIAHVRFNEHESEFLNKVVSDGKFNNKSDAIKTALRLMEFDSLVNEVSSKFKKPSYNKVMQTAKLARSVTYKKFFGSSKK